MCMLTHDAIVHVGDLNVSVSSDMLCAINDILVGGVSRVVVRLHLTGTSVPRWRPSVLRNSSSRSRTANCLMVSASAN